MYLFDSQAHYLLVRMHSFALSPVDSDTRLSFFPPESVINLITAGRYVTFNV